jgi:nucleoside-diphosphate-sugar epimerase
MSTIDRGRLLVTGATGFVGRWLSRMAEASGWEVYGLSRSAVGLHRHYCADIRDKMDVEEVVAAVCPNVVVHLAGISHPLDAEANPVTTIDTNVGGTRNLLDALQPSQRFVYASTAHVYGAPMGMPIDESHPCVPRGVYATSKKMAEELVKRHTDHVILRCFHLIGPGQQSNTVLSDWIQQALNADVVQVGDISIERDFLDVRDAVSAILLLASSKSPVRLANLCSGRSWRLEELLRKAGIENYVVDSGRCRPTEVRVLRGDNSRLRQEGWEAKIGMDQTLDDLRASLCARP